MGRWFLYSTGQWHSAFHREWKGLNTPNPDFTGDDSFTYTVFNKDGVSYSAPVTIEVVNHTGPVAVDDVYVTPADTPVTIDALDNDRPDWLKGRSILIYKFKA